MTAGSSGTGGSSTSASSGTTGTGGSAPPPATCPAPIQPADVSSPTTVVGTGSAASCTETALAAALAKGGVVTFECGAAPVTLTVSAQQNITVDTVIDGGGTVTLSGGGKTRILHLASAYNVSTPKLTVQHLAFTGGFTTDVLDVGNLGNGLTVVDCTFSGNSATGTDGNPGNGGNGGAIMFDGAMTTESVCGSTFTGNTAKAQGGAIFRVAYTDEPTDIDRCTFDGNSADATVGLAGAVYLENTTITMTATTLSNNTSHYGGGMWVGQSAIANLTNVTVVNNSSDQGGGFWFADDVSGTFLNCTIAGNTSGYGGALFSGSNAVELENTLLSDNDCKGTAFPAGGVNLGFMGGETCITGALASDPLLGPLQDNGGPTKTELPGAGSPAIGKGTGCPTTDQRGQPRQAACTLGAVEAG